MVFIFISDDRLRACRAKHIHALSKMRIELTVRSVCATEYFPSARPRFRTVDAMNNPAGRREQFGLKNDAASQKGLPVLFLLIIQKPVENSLKPNSLNPLSLCKFTPL